MIEVLAFGIIAFMGLMFLAIKLPKIISLKLLGHALLVDIAVTIVMLYIHWGSFNGAMVAGIAGVATSVFTSSSKWLFGYIRKDKYHPGFFNRIALIIMIRNAWGQLKH